MTYRQPEPFKTLCAAFFIPRDSGCGCAIRAALPKPCPYWKTPGSVSPLTRIPDAWRIHRQNERHAFVEAAAMGDLWTLHMLPPCPVTQIAPGSAQVLHVRAFWTTTTSARKLAWRVSAWRKPRFAGGRDGLARPGCPPPIGALRSRTRPICRLPRFGSSIPGIAPQENERLAAPIWMGSAAEEPRRFLSRPSPAAWSGNIQVLSLQCIAPYRRRPGLFISSDDRRRSRSASVCLEARNRGARGCAPAPGARPGRNRYEPAYRVALGTFEGDWFTAAERYRVWASSNLGPGKPASKPAVWKTGPSKPRSVWNRGRSGQVLTGPRASGADRTARERLLALVARLPHDIGFPEYLRPAKAPNRFVTPFMLPGKPGSTRWST